MGISKDVLKSVMFYHMSQTRFTNEFHNGFIVENRIIPYQPGIKVHVKGWGGMYTIVHTDLGNNAVTISCNVWENRGYTPKSIPTDQVRPAGVREQGFEIWKQFRWLPFEDDQCILIDELPVDDIKRIG